MKSHHPHRIHPFMAIALMAAFMRPTDGEASENGGAPAATTTDMQALPAADVGTLAGMTIADASVTTTGTVDLVDQSTLADSATTVGGVTTPAPAASEPHPAVHGLAKLREKLNSLGSFVVAETDALLVDIENLFK